MSKPRPLFPSAPRLCCTLLIATLGLSACGDKKAAPSASAVPVSVIQVQAAPVPVSAEFVAQTQSSRQVEIRTRVAGFLDKRVYREGDMVKEGEVLFLMDKKPFAAQLAAARAQLAQEQARYQTAKANLDRVRPLAAQNALSQKDLDDATGQTQSAAAAVEAAKAKVIEAELNLSYCTIKSPVKGLSSFAKVQDGTYLSPTGENALLTYVAALDPMRVVFSISENEALKNRDAVLKGRLQPPPNQDYQVEIVLADGSVYPHTGRITFADVDFSQQTGTTQLRAEVANPDGALRPGQFVRARLKGAMRPDAILVPQAAVQQGDKGHFVWVVDKEGKAQPRNVEVGPWQGDQWFIDAGLASGETVVVTGVMKLAPGVPVRVTPPEAEPASAANATANPVASPAARQ